jgi:hypothetical protein
MIHAQCYKERHENPLFHCLQYITSEEIERVHDGMCRSIKRMERLLKKKGIEIEKDPPNPRHKKWFKAAVKKLTKLVYEDGPEDQINELAAKVHEDLKRVYKGYYL